MAAPRQLKNPVCGMMVPADAPLRAAHQGTDLRLLQPALPGAVPEGAAAFLGEHAAPIPMAPPSPERRRRRCRRRRRVDVPDAPGDRPRPGRAAARSAGWRWSRDDHHAPRSRRTRSWRDMTRRFWVSVALPVAAAGARDGATCCRSPCGARPGDAAGAPWIELALATPVVLWGGWPFFVRGVAVGAAPQPEHVHADRPRRRRGVRLQRGRDAARPASFPPSFREQDGQVGVYFEAAAVIVTLVLLGQVLELRARSRTGRAHPGAAGPGARRRRGA